MPYITNYLILVDSNWLKSFLSSLILFCNFLLHIGTFLSAALLTLTPILSVTKTAM